MYEARLGRSFRGWSPYLVVPGAAPTGRRAVLPDLATDAPMLILTATLALSLFDPDPTSDWPCFLGPERTGRVPTAESFDWAGLEPKVAWRVATGPGYGGVAVSDGDVFLFDREVGARDFLRVLDIENGEERWKAGYEAAGRLQFAGSRTVPAVTDTHVFTAGGFGHITSFDRVKKEIAWSVDLQDVYGGRLPMFGFSAAPVLVGDMVVVPVLGEDIGLVALDQETGKDVWITESVGHSHSTPTVLELLGKEQIVFLSTKAGASGRDQAAPTLISSFEPVTGELLWQTEITLTRLPIPGPVQVDDERFFVTGGYRGGSTLMRISKDGGYELEELFHVDRGAQVQTPVLHDGHLYLLANENWNNDRGRRKEGGLMCLGLDGEELWRTGAEPFFGRGPSLLVGDHLLIQDGFDGVLRVARATPEGYEQVAEADLFQVGGRRDHQMWAPLALAGRRLLMRSQDELLCVEL